MHLGIVNTTYLAFLTIVLLVLVGCKPSLDTRKQIGDDTTQIAQQIYGDVGLRLPEEASGIQYFFERPSDQLDYFRAYIKFQATEPRYDELVLELGMERYFSTQNLIKYSVPGSWQPNITLEWWDASLDIPKSTAVMQFGNHGWLVSKYENTHVYIVVRDN